MGKKRSTWAGQTIWTDGTVDWFILISISLALLFIGATIGILLFGGNN